MVFVLFLPCSQWGRTKCVVLYEKFPRGLMSYHNTFTLNPKCWSCLNHLAESASALWVFWNLLLSLRHSGLRCVMCDLRGSLHSHTLDRPTPKGEGGGLCVFSTVTPPKWLNALCQSSLSDLQRFTRQLMPWRNGLPSSILIPAAFLSSLPSFLPVRVNLMWHIFTRTQAAVIVRALVDPEL